MLSQTVIDALESCKAVLIDELYKELKEAPGWKREINIPIMGEQDYYSGNYSTETITAVYLGKNEERDVVMVDYENFDEQFRDPVELFTVDNISDILSAL